MASSGDAKPQSPSSRQSTPASSAGFLMASSVPSVAGSTPRSELSSIAPSDKTGLSVTSNSSLEPKAKKLKSDDKNTAYMLSSDSGSSKESSTITDQLIQLTCDYIEALNTRAWDDAYKLETHFHPSYLTECRFTHRTQTFPDSVETIKEQARLFPGFQCKLKEASGKVDEDGKSAHCFFHCDWVDCPPGQVLQVMYAIEWRYADGMWLCYRTNVMQGLDEMV